MIAAAFQVVCIAVTEFLRMLDEFQLETSQDLFLNRTDINIIHRRIRKWYVKINYTFTAFQQKNVQINRQLKIKQIKLLILVIAAGIVLQTAKGTPLKVNCEKRATADAPIGSYTGELIYLDRHHIACKPFEFLNDFLFVRNDDHTGAFYRYTCCHYTL